MCRASVHRKENEISTPEFLASGAQNCLVGENLQSIHREDDVRIVRVVDELFHLARKCGRW